MSRQPRTRPAIKPIKTNHSPFDFAGPSDRALAALNSPGLSATPISPFRPPPLYPQVLDNDMKLQDRAAVDRLDHTSRLFGKREWSASPPLHRSLGEMALPTPVTAPPMSYPLSASIVEPGAGRRSDLTAGFASFRLSRAACPTPPPSVRPVGRRQSAPSGAAAFRYLRFQQFRETLWKQGTRLLGNASRADNFVVATQLHGVFVTPDNRHGTAIMPYLNRHRVRAVVHSRNKAPMALTREFDLDALRATVPEPLPTPSTPHFDRGLPPMAIAARNGMLSPASPAAFDVEGATSVPRSSREAAPSPMSARLRRAVVRPESRPVPIHLVYARTQLPVLAAIIMSDRVPRGDLIEIPLPFPRAWLETVAFVYTGNEEFATAQVKQNVLYLGGRV